jgi:hypothetical protein
MLPDLKIDVPQLEPDSRLLAQLSELSAASTPRGGGAGGAARVLMAAASVVLVAGVSWLTGTLPGTTSPFRPQPVDSPTHSQAPEEPGPGDSSVDDDVAPFGRPFEAGHPGILATLPGHDNGNHYGQIKPHTNNGNHYGQTKPHDNNGNHTGQTKPHDNNGNHTGQTKPHDNNGNQNGQIKPDD